MGRQTNALYSTSQPLEGKSLTERFKLFTKQYGRLGIFVYLGISTVSVSTIYVALKSGIDVRKLIEWFGLQSSTAWENAGTFAIAYGIHKVLMPFRLMITFLLTRRLAKMYPNLLKKKQ